MKPSHLQTPRNLADCTFVTGHSTMHNEPPIWETVAGYLLAVAIGLGFATILFYGLSK